jgi:hypothetical protein
VLGTAAMSRLPAALTDSLRGLFTLFVLSDVALAVTGLAPNLGLACVALFGSGLFIGPAATLYQAVIQTSTPEAYLGRVSGITRAVSFGLEPVSAAMVGVSSKLVASGTILLGGGLVAAAIDLFALLRGAVLDRRSELPLLQRRPEPGPGG